ncbi:type I restriction and modification enzyme subunit R-like protein [Chitinophaga skermanii]|uniref:Type I restriction and modification enzyme subunit R-like protein n=1 Tax=Chitinophaga skermanii TaxID=331697 RepID=A0A327Q5Q5_9BACT|nr:type I restriction enzyme HsdR N-terminal domain-containing protein [Chitinophaga skermanii]RAI99865.1 type I restriction and modification enzyme subunit R-like protein [Chitinophaga skermanii]
MIKIEFPAPNFKIVPQDGQHVIFDVFRKKYVQLTPEEWVRQNFLNYLTQTLAYPAALLSIEKEVYLGELKKRCDIIVYDRNTQPWMIVECKEMEVPLTQTVLEQIIRYHMAVPVSYLVITNGQHTFCCKKNLAQQRWEFLPSLPTYGK